MLPTTTPSDESSTSGNGHRYPRAGDDQLTSRKSVQAEMGELKTNVDALLARSAMLSEEELDSAYRELIARFFSMRLAARHVASTASRQFNHGVDVTSDYVRDKPLQSVALAAGAGLLLGMIYGRSEPASDETSRH